MEKFNDIINKDVTVLVDFFATWCGPCKTLSPILDDLKKELGDKIYIVKIDVDKNVEIANVLQIKGVPTLILYKNGQNIWRQSGIVSKKELLSIINKEY